MIHHSPPTTAQPRKRLQRCSRDHKCRRLDTDAAAAAIHHKNVTTWQQQQQQLRQSNSPRAICRHGLLLLLHTRVLGNIFKTFQENEIFRILDGQQHVDQIHLIHHSVILTQQRHTHTVSPRRRPPIEKWISKCLVYNTLIIRRGEKMYIKYYSLRTCVS